MLRRLNLFTLIFLSFSISHANAQMAKPPVSLQGYIDIALKQNPEVQAARAKWKQADARVDQATGNLWPKIDFDEKYTSFEGGRVIQLGNQQFNTAKIGVIPWDTRVTATWPIFNYAVWQVNRASKAYKLFKKFWSRIQVSLYIIFL